jgi:hypothetical protein
MNGMSLQKPAALERIGCGGPLWDEEDSKMHQEKKSSLTRWVGAATLLLLLLLLLCAVALTANCCRTQVLLSQQVRRLLQRCVEKQSRRSDLSVGSGTLLCLV